MENLIKNWKLLKSGVSVIDALETFENQSHNGTEGIYAIKSEKSGRFITPFDKTVTGYRNGRKVFDTSHENDKMSVNEVKGSWMILVPDNTKEKMTNEIAQLLKRSNWTGLTYQHIDHLHLPKMWEYVSANIGEDENLIYKTMKWFFENEIYKNK